MRLSLQEAADYRTKKAADRAGERQPPALLSLLFQCSGVQTDSCGDRRLNVIGAQRNPRDTRFLVCFGKSVVLVDRTTSVCVPVTESQDQQTTDERAGE